MQLIGGRAADGVMTLRFLRVDLGHRGRPEQVQVSGYQGVAKALTLYSCAAWNHPQAGLMSDVGGQTR